MDVIRSWNLTSYTNNQATAEAIADFILQGYWPLLVAFDEEMQQRWHSGQ